MSTREQQPIRVPTGGRYGDAQRLRDIQQSAPMLQDPVAAPETQQGPPTSIQGRMPGGPPPLTAPTQLPHEPITAGVSGANMSPSAEHVLRILVERYPSPYLIRLLRSTRRGH